MCLFHWNYALLITNSYAINR